MAMILDAFVNRFSDLLVNLVEKEVTTLLGVDKEIKKLQSTIETIRCVLQDAERRKIDDRGIHGWLKKLKDVMYDADDILDLCRIEADKYSTSHTQEQSTCFSLATCFRNPVFAHKIGKSIKNLNHKLQEISKEKDMYGLIKLGHSEGRVTEVSDMTSSLVDSDLVGSKIIEDARKMVELLLSRDEDINENFLVFAILGIGGIGKTTLAQLIFNNEAINDEFQLKIWVSVSKTFDENDLLRDVIGNAKGDHGGAHTKYQLEIKLVAAVWGKKLLLVLDDVWDVRRVWDMLLKTPLSRCASGSRIILTTRNEGVARQMKAVYSHQMETLPLEDGWSLLCKKLVLSGREEEIEHLKDTGLMIVDKCGRLPLAVKAIVPLLCTKTRRDWEHVLGSPAWSVTGLPEEVNRALYLSYMDLPSHLKQCFMYCFLLPKGYEISREDLIKLWIAEGFIKGQDESSLSMEETGEVYYRELTWRNLLQRGVYGLTYNMHDLLRSLAAFLAQEESLLVESHDSFLRHNTSMKLRRLSFLGKEMNADVLRNRKSLRTLILYKNQSHNLDVVLDRLSFLRVLDFRCSKIDAIPESLASLAHLRYLNLQQTLISRLPENIGNLKNLLALNLQECERLDRLPNSVVALKNLRGLIIRGTRVKGIPAGIGRLCQLRTLGGYRLHTLEETNTTTCNWSTLEQLGSLLHLRQLDIDNLEMASGSPEARAVALMAKSHLIHLHMRCTRGWVDEASDVDIKRINDVFEALQPPSCVEMLHIIGFPGSRFPSWMMTPMFYDLRFLELDECQYCENLPPLGQLPNLIHLHIIHWPSVTAIGPEFMGAQRRDGGSGESTQASTYIAFPKLQKLIFKKMHGWQTWQWEAGSHAMPCLEALELYDCPKLGFLPEGLSHHATALRELTIVDTDSLESVGNVDSLKVLMVVNCSCLERIFHIPGLKRLEVNNCQSLSYVGRVYSLQFIVLTDYKMESLPNWLSEDEDSPKPEKLDIYCNEQLFKKICQRGPEDWPKIQRINQVEIDCDVGHASYTKGPCRFNITSCQSIRHPSRIMIRVEPPCSFVDESMKKKMVM